MKTERIKLPPYNTAGRFWKSILLSLPMFLISFVFLSGGSTNFQDPKRAISFLIVFLLFNYLFFRILYTGKTDRYRAVIFIMYAVFLSFAFIMNMFRTRNAMSFNSADLMQCQIPFCHLVISMILIPAALTNSIIFPGHIIGGFAPVASMVAIWGLSSLALGKGFCSWGCFYGGWEDGFSRILKKPRMKNVNILFRWSAFAVLLLVAISSAFLLSPVYCDWLCPFKTVTEFQAVTSTETLVKTIIFASLFAGLVVILPVLTKKRMQCTTLCPLGALNSFTNKINAFDIRIDKEKCTKCKKCIDTCPTLSLDESSYDTGRAHFTCCKCGKCIDVCTNHAIHYHIKGVPVNKALSASRFLFVFSGFLFLAVFSGGSIQMGVYSIINLITTGSLS
jgi:ferredoxin-type protein NapH